MTHVLWVIRDVELNGDIHFHIRPKVKSSSGQKGQILKIIFFFLKTCLPILPSRVHQTPHFSENVEHRFCHQNLFVTYPTTIHHANFLVH